MKEYSNNQFNNVNEWSKESLSQKTKRFLENTKKAVRDTIAATWIAISTLVPSSVHSLATLTAPTAAALMTACCDKPDITAPTVEIVNREINISWWETLRISGNQVYIWNTLIFRCSDDVSTNLNITVTFNWKSISSWYVFNEWGTISVKARDEAGNLSSSASSKVNMLNNAPTIDLKQSQVDVSKPKVVSIESSKLTIWWDVIATWSDDKTQNCKVSLTLDGKEVKSWDTLDKEGTLVLTVTDADGKSSSVNIKLNVVNNAPTIDLKQSEVDVSKPKVVSIESNKLTIWWDVIATWSDDKTQNCTVSLTLDGKEVKSWDTLDKEGTLVLTVTDADRKSSTVNIKLNVVNNAPTINIPQSNINIYWEIQITISGNKLLLWSEEIASRTDDRTENCTVSIKFNGKEVKSWDIINETGTLSITVTDGEWKSSTKEISITKEVIEYQGVNINNIKPVEILPIIWQVQEWDKECYSHIEHLRIAEATRIRDMMWKYGAGNHSPEQYQELMMRLNTGMVEEYPLWYSNFEVIWEWNYWDQGGKHAHSERSMINSLLNHTNLKVVYTSGKQRQQKLDTFMQEHTQSIFILWCSSYGEDDKEVFDERQENSKVRELCKSWKLILFKSGWNIRTRNGIFRNKTYQKDVTWDQHWIYSLQSNANWKNDSNVDIALLVTVWTNAKWDVDQTNEKTSSSRFPVWFHDKSLFAWRAFPVHDYDSWKITAEGGSSNHWKYATSFTNYVNMIMMDLCFQMFAEVKDVYELLEMVRSTCDTDYIRLDWETQELQLMNPAKFFKKYLMPKNIPSNISAWQTIPLEKGYYKWVVFAIPWAEVKINWQWIEYSKENESLIKSQNPMTLEWRLNWDLVIKYNKNGTVTWKVIAVDDQWNGLNLDMEDIKVSIQNIAGITTIGIWNTIILTNILNQWPIYDIPSSIHPWENIMLTNLSDKWVIYDIPWAQPYIKWKSWVEYNNENIDLVREQDLKNTLWRLNWDIAMKESKDGYIKWSVYALDDKWEAIDKKEVAIRVEEDNNYYNKGEWDYKNYAA